MRDASLAKIAVKPSLELTTIIRLYAIDRQLPWGDVLCHQRQKSGRCVILHLNELHQYVLPVPKTERFSLYMQGLIFVKMEMAHFNPLNF